MGPIINDAVVCAEDGASLKNITGNCGIGNWDSDSFLEHSTKEEHMWLSAKGQIPAVIEFDLKKPQTIESIAVWNYNKEAYTDFGVASMDVSIWTQETGWERVLKQAQLDEGQGSDDYDDPTVIIFKPVVASKVRFENMKAFNPKAEQLGLSEVHFYAPIGPEAFKPVPENDSEVKVAEKIQLRWTGGKDAIVHDVYAGESKEALKLLGRIKGEPRAFLSGVGLGEQYYWRIDEVTEKGEVAEGAVWSFRTAGKQIGHWKLDEADGDIVKDSFADFNGKLIAGPKWRVDGGKIGGALEFDGEDDYVEVPALNLNTTCITMSCWVRADAQEDDIVGVVFSRAANSVAGMILNKGDSELLRYHWNDDEVTWGWETGLYVPRDKWVFIALVVDPAKAVMYLYDEGELKSAENIRQHNVEEFDGPLCFGKDSVASNDRYFKGMIDDVQIFDYALSKGQIESLCQGEVVGAVKKSQLALVDAELIEDGQSLGEVAKEHKQPENVGRSKNLLAVVIIICVVLLIGAVTGLKKKK